MLLVFLMLGFYPMQTEPVPSYVRRKSTLAVCCTCDRACCLGAGCWEEMFSSCLMPYYDYGTQPTSLTKAISDACTQHGVATYPRCWVPCYCASLPPWELLWLAFLRTSIRWESTFSFSPKELSQKQLTRQEQKCKSNFSFSARVYFQGLIMIYRSLQVS